MITATQCRAARAGLRWTVHDLAAAAKINFNTVVRFERDGDPRGSKLAAIEAAFKAAGVELDPDGLGVRFPRNIRLDEKPTPKKAA